MAFIPEEKVAHQAGGSCRFKRRSLRALVVDDHHATLKVVYHMLDALGYSVDSANGGLSAMLCIRHSAYDLVVTDLKMADMDGYALSGWIKHSTRKTKVVIMTECCQSEVVNYMNSGIVDGWIFKPFGMKALDKVAHEVVRAERPGQPLQRAFAN